MGTLELLRTFGNYGKFWDPWELWGTSGTVANFGLELWVEWNFPVPTQKFQPEVPKRSPKSQIFQSSQSSLATFTNKLEKNGKNDMEDTYNMLKW